MLAAGWLVGGDRAQIGFRPPKTTQRKHKSTKTVVEYNTVTQTHKKLCKTQFQQTDVENVTEIVLTIMIAHPCPQPANLQSLRLGQQYDSDKVLVSIFKVMYK